MIEALMRKANCLSLSGRNAGVGRGTACTSVIMHLGRIQIAPGACAHVNSSDRLLDVDEAMIWAI